MRAMFDYRVPERLVSSRHEADALADLPSRLFRARWTS